MLLVTPLVSGDLAEVVDRLSLGLLLIICVVGKPTKLEFEELARVLLLMALVVGKSA